MTEHKKELESGSRFAFGSNWAGFLEVLDDSRVAEAELSLTTLLDTKSFEGRLFMDVGSGSGLFSLAARRLGAEVVSIDFDPESVKCTNELKNRFYPEDAAWKVVEGSALDEEFLNELPQADIVYSWGVLHHTGDLWGALVNVAKKARNGGCVYIALYNDQGTASDLWLGIKRTYNRVPRVTRPAFVFAVILPFELLALLINIVKLSPMRYFKSWTGRRGNRGMRKWIDWVDWVGGLPFQVAEPGEVVDSFTQQGFTLSKLRTVNGWGNNEFVFKKNEICD